MRAKFFVVRKIKSIDKVPRNVGLMTRDKVRCGMRCAKKDSCEKREKERKRVKKSERADKREKISKILSCFFFGQSFLFFLVSLSLTLSLTLSSKNRHRRKVEKKKRSTKHFFVEVSLSSGEIYDSNAQNRFRMAPRRLDRRSERVFHFQRTVERISRRARKEEYE